MSVASHILQCSIALLVYAAPPSLQASVSPGFGVYHAFSAGQRHCGMRRPPLALLPLLLCGRAALALPLSLAPNDPGLLCRPAIAMAEAGAAIPPRLLSAIGRVESGRRGADGRLAPWPWTINAEGQGHFFDSKAEAVAAVRALQARGVRSIDVGCLQVNLMHHPDAFASLDAAFDPGANAAYAARFLAQLHDQLGTWPKAAGAYHSQTPELGEDYRNRVLAAWPAEQAAAGGPLQGLASYAANAMPMAPSGFGRGIGLGRPGGGLGPMILPTPGGGRGHVIPATAPLANTVAGAQGGNPLLAAVAGAGRPGGVLPTARGLDFYRRAPIVMATRAPARLGG